MAKMIANKSPHTSISFPNYFGAQFLFSFTALYVFKICIKSCIVPFCVIIFFLLIQISGSV